MKYPVFGSPVFYTSNHTPYLKEPGVALIGATQCDLSGVQEFLDGFSPDLNFQEYLEDPAEIPSPEQLIKFAGQLCYYSLGPKRTWNEDAFKYLTHIKEAKHGSILEMALFNFLCWGIDRSVTHEAVRHRIGSYAQTSQRYADGKVLRFVERPEFQNDPILHEAFETWIDASVKEYNSRAERLLQKQLAGDPCMSAERKTDLRKKVNQAARSCLPNETEAPIVISLNGRALRHVLEMRAASAADVQIRAMAVKMYLCVKDIAPNLFADYTLETLPDGTQGLSTIYRKV